MSNICLRKQDLRDLENMSANKIVAQYTNREPVRLAGESHETLTLETVNLRMYFIYRKEKNRANHLKKLSAYI